MGECASHRRLTCPDPSCAEDGEWVTQDVDHTDPIRTRDARIKELEAELAGSPYCSCGCHAPVDQQVANTEQRIKELEAKVRRKHDQTGRALVSMQEANERAEKAEAERDEARAEVEKLRGLLEELTASAEKVCSGTHVNVSLVPQAPELFAAIADLRTALNKTEDSNGG